MGIGTVVATAAMTATLFLETNLNLFNRLHANKNFNCALRNAVAGARETQRIDCLVGG